MSYTDRAARLIQRITTNPNGFGTDIIFTTPDGMTTKTITALTTKHMIKSDENGFKSIGKTESIAVSAAALEASGYPIRNGDSQVSLLQHRVTWTDVSGLTWTYTVRQNRPDEKLGFILLILDDYKA